MNPHIIVSMSFYFIAAALAFLTLRFFITTLRPIPVIRFKPHRYNGSFVTLRFLEGRRQVRHFLDEGMVCEDRSGQFYNGRQFWMQTCDISLGGVGFVGNYRIPRGTPLEVKFHHLGSVISFTGTVMWTKRVKGNQFCGGLKFNPDQVPL
jgi:hypothetical protein